MKTSLIPSHRAKTRALAELCKSAADLEDSRIQAYLAKSLAIMASAYVEICVRETISEFCKRKGTRL